MPNYIRTQNPWLGAADAMSQGVAPLAQLYSQLPHVRMQMQQHADQMGIEQGRLNLAQQEYQSHVPLWEAETGAHNAQARNFDAEAGLHNSQADQVAKQVYFALQANQAAINKGTDPVVAALTGSAGLNPEASRNMANDMTKPMMLNVNQTANSNPSLGPVHQLATGVISLPVGNSGYVPQIGTNVPSLFQTGQQRAGTPGRSAQDQIVIDASRGMSSGNILPGSPQLKAALALTNLLQQVQAPQTVVKPMVAPSGMMRVKAPDGRTGSLPIGSQLPDGWIQIQ